ncbi:hypothetical protein ACVWW2_002275 [Bradyrhizobium sp. LM4.3]
MTLLGLFLGIVATDVETGSERFTFGIPNLLDGIELVGLALGLFGVAEFMKSVNQYSEVNTRYSKVGLCDLRPSRDELRRSIPAMLRGTIIASLCSLIPGTGPTIASFISYAAEKKVSKTPEKFGAGMNRRRRLSRSIDAFVGTGRLHPDYEPRHSWRRGHGPDPGCADDPGHRTRSPIDQRAPRHLLGPDRVSGSATSCWSCSTSR